MFGRKKDPENAKMEIAEVRKSKWIHSTPAPGPE
jgi:hypothetical protein